MKMTRRIPLDLYDELPKAMRRYLSFNGWHFNKELCAWAVGQLWKTSDDGKSAEKMRPWTKDEVDALLSSAGVRLENNTDHDYVFVANMLKSDYMGRSVTGEAAIAKMTKDYVDDIDQEDGFILNRFFADCSHKGIAIPWQNLT